MNWFDYIYYRAYQLYINSWESDIPGWYANGVVSVLQGCNILMFLFILDFSFGLGFLLTIPKWYGGVLFGVIILLNLTRYTKIRRDKLTEKWSDELVSARKTKGVFIIIYLVLSILFCFGLAAVFGSINQGRL